MSNETDVTRIKDDASTNLLSDTTISKAELLLERLPVILLPLQVLRVSLAFRLQSLSAMLALALEALWGRVPTYCAQRLYLTAMGCWCRVYLHLRRERVSYLGQLEHN